MLTPKQTPDAPRLPEELQERLFDTLLRRAEDTVAAHDDRDEMLAANFDMLARSYQGAGPSSGQDARWRNACDIVDPLVFEQFMGLFAATRAATSQRPFWTVVSRNPDDSEAAREFSRWVEETSELDGLDDVLYMRDYITLRDGMAALHASWDSYGEWMVKPQYRLEDGTLLDTPPGTDSPVDVYDVEYNRTYVPARHGIKWTAIDRADVYTTPPNCADPNRAESAMHRVWLSAHDLLRGVEEFGYDRETVHTMLREGPTHSNDGTTFQETASDIAGVELGGSYEVFIEYGYLPIILNEEGEIEPKLHDLYSLRFEVVHCPARNAVLRWRYWPHDRLPYVFSWMLRTPNSMDGESVPSVVGPFQEEATANVRLYYDAANLVLSPMFRVKEASLREFGAPEAFPGAAIPYRTDPREVEPMPFNLGGLQIGLQTVEHPLSRARQALSGESTIKMDDRVRKATEVQASLQGMTLKFSLVLANVQASMKDVLEVMTMLYKAHAAPDQPEGPLLDMLHYQVIPRANSQNLNPVIRLANVQTAMQLLRSSPLYEMALQRGDLRVEYHLLMEALAAVSYDSIGRMLGDEPVPMEMESPELMAQQAIDSDPALLQALMMDLQAQAQAQQPQTQPRRPQPRRPRAQSGQRNGRK